MKTKRNITINYHKIKRWVKERDGTPARVKETDSPGILRIDFEGYTGKETLEHIGWDEFFAAFEEADLAFLYSPKSESRFSKFLDRDDYELTDEEFEIPEFPGNSTPEKEPPMKVTKAAKEKHHEIARRQGEALGAAFSEMANNVAQRGEEKAAGEYLVGYAIEKPEALYRLQDGKLVWKKPKNKNNHIEISVRDGANGRLIPGLRVMVTILDQEGQEVGTHRHKLLWHPWLYHYGRNWQLPGDGEYTIRVHIPIPEFHRHDKENGKRFEKPVWVEFKNVKFSTKQPKYNNLLRKEIK